jgi:hypothetical protein
MRRFPFCCVLVLALAAGACDDTLPTTTTPTTPETSETFGDVLTPNGAKTHPFITARSGNITATLTALDPNPDGQVAVGVSLGTLNALGVCQTLISRDVATVNSTVAGTASSATSLCLRVYDAAGTLTEPTTYSVTVVHP